ncbi:putative glycoside hydrolase family 15 protein [Rhodococcus pyridinivorans]|uniref:putative glycoside hydrolase n=1 Tax=Rhodococcus pyridinivorans TaxID=103816 RepID=UPI002009F7EA|nr:putative glycoside hydrolase [Rhodococcus pyridinivorans]UPW02803.1 putative glycoside hydrolase family 15 protein [Rhodococcus pyridinivorans]
MSRILLVVLVTTSSLSCAAPTARETTARETTADAASTAMSLPGMPATGEPTFPRTATYYLDQDRLPPMDELARYDLVVLDHEWAHRVPESYFDGLRSRNPRVRLLAYMNLVDLPGALGSPGYWADRYALWQFDDPNSSAFPEEWLATTASGEPVSEWPRTTMANLTDVAPRVDGRIYAEYAAEWVADQVWSTGIWDGVLLDVWGDRIYSADADAWDIDGDGVDEPDSQIYGPDGPWARGLTVAERIMRERMPDAIIVANGDRSPVDGLLDGRAWESFADPMVERDPGMDLDRYLETSAGGGHRSPGVWMTIDRLGTGRSVADTYRRARFFLTATLLGDGYWAPMLLHYGSTAYYDEMDGAGLGPGYLGLPVSEVGLQGDAGRTVLRRDFENGIVLVNSGDNAEHVYLERPYRHLQGTQDPSVNDGSVTDEVVLEPLDGLILLRTD